MNNRPSAPVTARPSSRPKTSGPGRSVAPRATQAPYHHGDLRNALVQAGLESLEREGPDGLSLRAIASHLGVSHAAPAHHFGTLMGLRTALAAVGYARFGSTMQAAREGAGSDPETQMRAVGVSYIAFAEAHPALFRLMFTAALVDWSDAKLIAEATRARAELIAICRPAADRLGLSEPSEREALERLVWSSVHGFAHLTVSGQFGGEGSAPVDMLDISALLFGGPLRAMRSP